MKTVRLYTSYWWNLDNSILVFDLNFAKKQKMSAEFSEDNPFLRKKSRGGIHSLLQGKIKPSHVIRSPQVLSGPPQLEQFCLKYPSLDKKICDQLESQCFMNFAKVSRFMIHIKVKSRFFWVRSLQYQLGSYGGNIPNDWKQLIQRSPIEVVRAL